MVFKMCTNRPTVLVVSWNNHQSYDMSYDRSYDMSYDRSYDLGDLVILPSCDMYVEQERKVLPCMVEPYKGNTSC